MTLTRENNEHNLSYGLTLIRDISIIEYMNIPPSSLSFRRLGVYAIINKRNNKKYIGQSINLSSRFSCHLSDLRKNRHECPRLQEEYNQYGEDAFEIQILEYCKTKEVLIDREQYYADLYQSYIPETGYNAGKDMQCWVRGRTMTEEEWNVEVTHKGERLSRREFLSTINIGRPLSIEHKEKLKYCTFYGKHHTEERKKIIGSQHHARQQSMTEQERRKPFGHRMKTIYLIGPDDCLYKITGLHGFCSEYGLDRAAIFRVEKGQNNIHKGWRRFGGDFSVTPFIEKDYT